MPMQNPPHPGEFIREVYLEPNGITGRQLAAKLGVSPSTLNRVLQGTSGISPEMALRLSKALGRSPESWLAMQDNHDLWKARQTVDLGAVERNKAKGPARGPFALLAEREGLIRRYAPHPFGAPATPASAPTLRVGCRTQLFRYRGFE